MRGNGNGRRRWPWLVLTMVMALLALTVGTGPQAFVEAAGQPMVRVEITHTDAGGQRMSVTQVEFALRNDYVVNGNFVLKARGRP